MSVNPHRISIYVPTAVIRCKCEQLFGMDLNVYLTEARYNFIYVRDFGPI